MKIGAKKLMNKCCETGNYFPMYNWRDKQRKEDGRAHLIDKKIKRGVKKRVRITLKNEMLKSIE